MKALLFLVLIAISGVDQVLATDFSMPALDCLNDITNNSQLILKQIETIHAKYEKKVKIEKLSAYESGPYKANELLDLTIRKMHKEIVNKIASYPSAYKSQIAAVSDNGECVSHRLFEKEKMLVATFNDQWKKALQTLKKNEEFYNTMDRLVKKQPINPSSQP